MAARLNYLLKDIAVPAGTFVIGRGLDCSLTVDDPMASRRHAALHVGNDTTLLEDLESRNGVFLNGVRIHKTETLHHGDVIRVGSADIVFFDEEETRDENPGPEGEARRASRISFQTVEELIHDEVTNPMPATLAAGLAVICGVAEKWLALGRIDEAERTLQHTLAEILARAAGSEVDAQLAETAASYALRLAVAGGKGKWFDYALRLYTARKAPLPGKLADVLYAARGKADHTDPSVRHAYIAVLQALPDLDPAGRLALQHLESSDPGAR